MSESESVLPGKGKKDYVKYLKVPQLLDCQNIEQRFYPELWEVRNRLTRRSGTSY